MSEHIPHVDEILEKAKGKLAEKAPGYTIRRARQEDVERAMFINYAALPENYPRRFFEELFEDWGEAFYVAESPKGELVGYVMSRVEWKPGFFKKILTRSGHIVSIAVLEGYRRMGFGYALMAHAMHSLYHSYRTGETYLEVRVSNVPAVTLYESLGYRKVKVEKHYYLDGEDAYVMARPLP